MSILVKTISYRNHPTKSKTVYLVKKLRQKINKFEAKIF